MRMRISESLLLRPPSSKNPWLRSDAYPLFSFTELSSSSSNVGDGRDIVRVFSRAREYSFIITSKDYRVVYTTNTRNHSNARRTLGRTRYRSHTLHLSLPRVGQNISHLLMFSTLKIFKSYTETNVTTCSKCGNEKRRVQFSCRNSRGFVVTVCSFGVSSGVGGYTG